MKKNIFFIYLTVLVCVLSSYSQNKRLKLDSKFVITGIDYKSKNYLVFCGYDKYYKKSFTSQKWDSIPIKHNELEQRKDLPYIYFYTKGKNYLVDDGCGRVYEFRNDSIIRIDKSFNHKNQYNAGTFVYKDDIFYFGGYGMFTFKNILTQYIFKSEEWEVFRYANYETVPKPRDRPYSFLIDDNLYIINGLYNFYDNSTTNIFCTDIWKLDLKSKNWEFIGDISDSNTFPHGEYFNSYQSKNSCYFENDDLFKVDFKNNKLHHFPRKDLFRLSFDEKYNTENDEIIYSLRGTDKGLTGKEIVVEPFEHYSGDIITTEDLVKDFTSQLHIYIPLLVVLLLIGWAYFNFQKAKKKVKLENIILFKDNEFYHRNKTINNLSPDEKELLLYFFENLNNPIQMNEVVDFVSNKNDNNNYNTLTKRKDLIMNGIRQKISLILEIHPEDLFIEEKSAEDKRIKLIHLNPDYFKK